MQRRYQRQGSTMSGTLSKNHPVMTNASLMLLRLCGKYLHLMQRLQPIAYDVFVAMTQLLEYYFFNVHTFFTRDLRESHPLVTSTKYSSLLQRIERSLLQPKESSHVQSSISGQITSANNSFSVNTNSAQNNISSTPHTDSSPMKSLSALANKTQRLSLSTPKRQFVININSKQDKDGSTLGSPTHSPRKDKNVANNHNETFEDNKNLNHTDLASSVTNDHTFRKPSVALGALPQSSFSVNVRLPNLDQMSKNIEGFTSPDTLYGLAERTISSESVVYLIRQFLKMKYLILKSINQDENDIHSSIEEYYHQTIDVMEEIRRPVLMVVSERSVSSDTTLQLMSKISWDKKEDEVRSFQNQYVDILIRELQIFSMRLQEIHLKTSEANAQFMDQSEACGRSRETLWELASLASAFIFVEGFANAKKCNPEGRGQMLLDYRQFVNKLEKISEKKPLPHQEFVAQYVKAYYIPESDLENWVKYHTEYSPKQLMALVNCVAYSNNKTKQKLNSLINDLSGKIRSKT